MISHTVEYALRATLHLASTPAGTTLSSEAIANSTRVPKGYLSKIMRDLVVAGIVTSQRGPTGGFTLSRESAKVSVLDVVRAVDPIERILRCPLGNPAHVRLCPLHRRLDDALATIEKQFAEVSLADLIESNAAQQGACRSLVQVTRTATQKS